MQTPFEALTAQTSKLEAANEEFLAAGNHPGDARRDSASGWDPYEVWRARIKEPQDRFRSWPRPPLR